MCSSFNFGSTDSPLLFDAMRRRSYKSLMLKSYMLPCHKFSVYLRASLSARMYFGFREDLYSAFTLGKITVPYRTVSVRYSYFCCLNGYRTVANRTRIGPLRLAVPGTVRLPVRSSKKDIFLPLSSPIGRERSQIDAFFVFVHDT